MKRKFIFLFTLVFMLFVLSSCSSSKVRLKDLLDENREMYSKLSEYHSFIKTEIYFYDENSGECNSLNFSINGASLINCSTRGVASVVKVTWTLEFSFNFNENVVLPAPIKPWIIYSVGLFLNYPLQKTKLNFYMYLLEVLHLPSFFLYFQI